MTPDADLTETMLGLERTVWNALVAGDPAADGRMLSDDFLGVYPSGFAGRHDHMAQLDEGPTVESYTLSDARTIEITDGDVLLAYEATYQRPGHDVAERMFVSSLWSRREGGWVNTFSQDTPTPLPAPTS